jgi:hypothetical protein
VVLAAAPEVLNDNVLLFSGVILGALALFVVRAVQRLIARIVMLALILGVAVFIYVEREDLEQCGRTCTCRVAGIDVDVPACDPDLLPG